MTTPATFAPIQRRNLPNPGVPIDPIRQALPYGYWRTAAGELVLYDRHYRPIFTRRADGTVVIDHPDRWVAGIIEKAWFYSDATSPRINQQTRAKCEGILARWIAAARFGRPVPLTQLLHPAWRNKREKNGEAA
jgi:hypothetical protein